MRIQCHYCGKTHNIGSLRHRLCIHRTKIGQEKIKAIFDEMMTKYGPEKTNEMIHNAIKAAKAKA
jgi:hypothetical protein